MCLFARPSLANPFVFCSKTESLVTAELSDKVGSLVFLQAPANSFVFLSLRL
jgi:hypothetical protein